MQKNNTRPRCQCCGQAIADETAPGCMAYLIAAFIMVVIVFFGGTAIAWGLNDHYKYGYLHYLETFLEGCLGLLKKIF